MSVILNSNPVGAKNTGGSLLFHTSLNVISAETQFEDQIRINYIS